MVWLVDRRYGLWELNTADSVRRALRVTREQISPADQSVVVGEALGVFVGR